MDGYNVHMNSESEEENGSDVSGPNEPANKRGSNLSSCWGLCTNDSRKLGEESPIISMAFPKSGKIQKNMTVAHI